MSKRQPDEQLALPYVAEPPDAPDAAAGLRRPPRHATLGVPRKPIEHDAGARAVEVRRMA